MNKHILRLAIPNIISNITVPLLGMVDIAIAGHLESSLYIGAIALGTTIFNMIYWNFGFLRMGTSGFTAQSYGAKDFGEMLSLLLRSLMIALGVGLMIVLFQIPVFYIAQHFIKVNGEMLSYVERYFSIVVWSAPAMLAMYAFNGWFTGMQNAKTPMYIAIMNNLLNIALSYTFVYQFGMQLEGVALGTMLSQLITFFVFVVVWWRYYGNRMRKYLDWQLVLKWQAFKDFFKVNADIFIRTFLLVLVTTFFTFASSSFGNDVLSVNALLMQFFMLFSYFMDGFAYAGEALTGKFIGSRNEPDLKKMIRILFLWGVGLAIPSSLVYLFFTPNILSLLTDKTDIIQIGEQYTYWIVLIPIVSFATFIWDGVYVGATASRAMRNSMIVAAVLFFIAYYIFAPTFENNGLWLAFILYLLGRSAMQTLLARTAVVVK